MRRALLDTDTLSEFFKGKRPQLIASARAYLGEHDRFTISVVTVTEVVKGLRKMQREDRIDAFVAALATVEVVPFSTRGSILAGRVYGDLERTGQPIGRADPMIAATAIEESLVLVTGNVNHYERIRALGYPLELESWHG